MGKLLKTLMVALLAGCFFVGVKAQTTTNLISPPITGGADQPVLSGLFVGQTHKYKVIFRGNGEAIVYANIDFTNTTDNKLTEFVFETPVAVSEMTVLQYDKITCQYGGSYYTNMTRCATPMYDEMLKLDSSSAYYYGGTQNIYQKTKFTQAGNVYTVTLPLALDVNKDSSLLIGFTTKKFATEFWGGYDFKFESLKVDSRITDMTINVDVDGGLLLKNASTTTVNYTGTGDEAAAKSITPEAAVTNTTLDQLVSYMSYSGSVSKEFKELSSKETATLSGEYAPTWARLYMKEIVGVIVAAVVVFGALFVGIKLYKKFHKPAVKLDKPASGSKMWILVDTATGFGSALALLVFSLIIMFIGQSLTFSDYGYGYSIFMILASIVVIMVYAFFALFGPLLRGKKSGWKSFGLTFFSEIVFLIIMALIFVSIWEIPRIYPVY